MIIIFFSKKKLGTNLLDGMKDGFEVNGNKLGFMEGLSEGSEPDGWEVGDLVGLTIGFVFVGLAVGSYKNKMQKTILFSNKNVFLTRT